MPSDSDRTSNMTASTSEAGALPADPLEVPAPDRLKLEPRTSAAAPATAAAADETDSGGSDEVKLFNDEDESEAAPSGAENRQVDILSDIKSRLITETEQAKVDPRRDYGAFIAMPFAGMSPYQHLMSSMSYAAAAGMPFPNSASLARPPSLFYGDHLSSPPPPAHMPGIRPPVYLPHGAGQYPYSMLSTQEHLAAWHQQAAMYHQSGAALRAASPYNLPMASNGLTSPMSRFSPSGLLGHPGLNPAAAAAAAAQAAHLPHTKRESKHSDKPSSPKKNKEPHIKKPLNAFMLFMKEMRPVVQVECTLKESAAINQILGRRWHSLSRDEQSKYYEKARAERQKHLQMYPHWNARDNYRFGLKKKKRKRDRADDPGSSMKKCRARFGLDSQDQWCRPCRRKKKCIRVQGCVDEKTGEPKQATNQPPATNNNKVKREGIHSDGEEEDIDYMDDNSPRDSRHGRESLESISEQSVTSPAGFASLPSIGSPASLASPQTPSDFNGLGASLGSSDWFRPPGQGNSGAFRPPGQPAATSTSSLPPSSTSTASTPFHQLHPGHFYNAYSGLMQHHLQNMQREPVGTDPRDAKNPLSISQLTSSKKAAEAAAAAAALGAAAPGGLVPTGPAPGTGLFGQNCNPGANPGMPTTNSEKRTIVGMT